MNTITVWFVTGSTRFFDSKIEAEEHARELFPKESFSTRYARVYYREMVDMREIA